MKIASCEAMPSIKEFFPSIKNDLTKVIWTNDVYNDESFQEALNGSVGHVVNTTPYPPTVNLNLPNRNCHLFIQMKFPLWLNAITENMEEKDIDKFFSLCTLNFPEATISIGMVYKGQKLGSNREYTAELVTQMKNTLTRNNVTQTVAFSVFLPTAANSLDTLPALKDVHGITDSALYIYLDIFENFNDDIFSGARKLIKIFGKDRVYLDVSKKVHKKLI
ncbi:unnamed protein product [Timema podura]|uniref:Menorin-like domain-containing protein n=1 Tax=Timema podura TaxID=61482 RepID=A0ABN7NY27_TIMPD|nr:unnamed protein product [Timema podura]